MRRIFINLGVVVLLFATSTYGSVTARYDFQTGKKYTYTLSMDQTSIINSNDLPDSNTIEQNSSGDVYFEVYSFNDERFDRKLKYGYANLDANMLVDEVLVSSLFYDDDYLQEEKIDDRGFSREDVDTLSLDFLDIQEAAGLDDPNSKPFLSSIWLFELPPNSMNVDNTWQSNKDVYEEFNNSPTINVDWKLLDDDVSYRGVSCAKYEVKITDGSFSDVNGVIDMDETDTADCNLDASTFTLDGTLWFDVTDGKVIEWDADIHIDSNIEHDYGDSNPSTNAIVDANTTMDITFIYQSKEDL